MGKITNFENIEIKPIMFEKGRSKIAIYFLGHIKEVKLSSLLAQDKIKFKKVDDSYFTILCINQKREKETVKKESFPKLEVHQNDFPSFFNLVLWGGEAESSPEKEPKTEGTRVYHPGSSSIHEFNKFDVVTGDPGEAEVCESHNSGKGGGFGGGAGSVGVRPSVYPPHDLLKLPGGVSPEEPGL